MAKIGGNREWCPSAAAAGSEFIQIDLSKPFRVCALETQGHHTLFWFVSSYQVTYSLNGSTWFNVTMENKTVLVGTLMSCSVSVYISPWILLAENVA